MKKKFKDTKLSKIAGSILKGALVDTTMPIVGIATGAVTGLKKGLQESKSSNEQDETGGVGKPNWIRWASFGAAIVLIGLYAFGVIDEETLNKLVNLIPVD